MPNITLLNKYNIILGGCLITYDTIDVSSYENFAGFTTLWPRTSGGYCGTQFYQVNYSFGELIMK